MDTSNTCNNENNDVNTSNAPATTSDDQASDHNATPTTNVKMTLVDARTEMESKGFVIMEQPQELQQAAPHFLVASRKECYGWILLDTLVFVQELVQSDDPLTVSRIDDDLKKLKTDWLLSLPSSFYSPRSCPPHAVYRGRQILMIYLSYHPILSHVELRLKQKPPGEWNQAILVAAQDQSNGASYYYNETPLWGWAVYPELRYWANVFTGRRPLPEKPKRYKLVWALLLISLLVLLLVLNPPTSWISLLGWLYLIVYVVACFLCGFVYQECQYRRQRNHVPWSTMTNDNNNMI